MHKVLFSSKKDDWTTPYCLFHELNYKYKFDVDLCASDDNHLCSEYYTKDRSCFDSHIYNKSIFCNPPYGRDIYKFIEFCFLLSEHNKYVVLLLPVRTDTKWFHDFIYPYAEITFLKGRLKFGGSKNSAPFPSMICVFKGGYSL